MSRKTEPVQPSWWGALMHVHAFTHLGTLLRNANKMTNLEGIYHVLKVDHFQGISHG